MSPETLIATVGVSLLLVAFTLNLRGLLAASSSLYQGMNAVGAALSCLASAMIGFVPFVVLELVWLAVALAALSGIGRPRGSS